MKKLNIGDHVIYNSSSGKYGTIVKLDNEGRCIIKFWPEYWEENFWIYLSDCEKNLQKIRDMKIDILLS